MQPSHSVMGPFFVAAAEPLRGHLSHLIQTFKQIYVQHFLSEVPVE